MSWTMDLFYALASPDSQWENVIKPTDWLLPYPPSDSGSGGSASSGSTWSINDVPENDLKAFRNSFDNVAFY